MFNFFHTLGVGIIAAFVAFTGSFHSQSAPTVYIPETQTSTTTTISSNKKLATDSTVATTTSISNEARTAPSTVAPSTSKTAVTKTDSFVPFKYKPVASTTPSPAENFYDATLALYKDGLSFLNNRIGLDEVSRIAVKFQMDSATKYVSDSTKLQAQYSQTNTPALNAVATDHINFLNYEITQINKVYPTMVDRIAELNQLKSILEETTSSIPSQNISQADYMLRANALRELVDESNIEKTDSTLFNSLNDLFKIDGEYDDLEMKVALEQKAQADSAMTAIKAEASRIVIPVIQLPTITPMQTQPTSIHCETTYSANSGNPSTTCTDNSTLKSVHCDTTYNANSGNPSTTCIDYTTMKSMTCDTTYSAVSGNPSKDCSFR